MSSSDYDPHSAEGPCRKVHPTTIITHIVEVQVDVPGYTDKQSLLAEEVARKLLPNRSFLIHSGSDTLAARVIRVVPNISVQEHRRMRHAISVLEKKLQDANAEITHIIKTILED